MTEIRTQKLAGSNHVRHAIVVDGVELHAQLSPYSAAEIESRIRSHLNPMVTTFRAHDFMPGARGTAKSYGSKGGRAGRKTKAERDMPWLPPESDE